MNLRDSLNQYYFDMTVRALRRLGRTGGGELSYNSICLLYTSRGGCKPPLFSRFLCRLSHSA